jgi:hypothetical protein
MNQKILPLLMVVS